MPDRVFVLGGTRSGKSRHGRERAQVFGGDRVSFIATARAGDPELDARIVAHQADRPSAWQTIESDWDLSSAIARAPGANVLLIDSLTLWLSSAMERSASPRDLWRPAAEALRLRQVPVVIVSDEIGLGIVPLEASTRAFRDELGWLHQEVAGWASEVTFMVAGIPTRIKGR